MMTTDEREKLIESMRTKAEIRLCLGVPNMLWEQAEELQKAADELTRQAAKIAELQKKAAIVDTLEKLLEKEEVGIESWHGSYWVQCRGVDYEGPDLATALARAAGKSS